MRARKRSMLCTVSTVHCSHDSGALVNGHTPCSFRHACRSQAGPLHKQKQDRAWTASTTLVLQ